MPRRSPPTPLRLVTGPLPTRRQPKHTLPSVPRPAFHPPVEVKQGPIARARAKSLQEAEQLAFELDQLLGIALPERRRSIGRRSVDSGASSPVSVSSGPPSPQNERFVKRGPWDHSSSIRVPFDVEAVLRPLQPAALTQPMFR